MNENEIKVIKDVPKEELITGGTFACGGCGAVTGIKFTLKALGKNTIMVNSSGCMTLTALYPFTPYKVPWVHLAIENAGSVATGILMGLKAQGKDKDTNVVVYAGDGATYDIGFQSLSGAADRKENFIYVCYNNSFYSNTGFQRTGATPLLSETTSTPLPNILPRKHMAKIMVDHECEYVATACTSYPLDYMNKLREASKYKGVKFIDLLCPCVPGWELKPGMSYEAGKMMVDTGLWPVYKVVKGQFEVTIKPKMLPVRQAFEMQGRFGHLKDEHFKRIQDQVDKEWAHFEKGEYYKACEY
ncbi:MAG: thiamine pyrophosphate-dependent enzyme [Candidatus Diapherotrites archaeon]